MPLLVGTLLYRAAKLEKARARAQSARANAEELLVALYSEGALQKTAGTGSSGTLGRVRDATTKYLRSASDLKELNRSRALAGVADLQRLEGRLTASIKSYGEALDAAKVRSPGPPLLRHVARLQARLGDALMDQGRSGPARSAYEESVRAWRTVLAGQDREPDDCTGLGSSLVSLARQSEVAGETRAALSNLAEAIQLAFGRLTGRGTACLAGGGAETATLLPRLDEAAVNVLGRAALLRDRLLGLSSPSLRSGPVAADNQQRWHALVAAGGREANTPVRQRERAALLLSNAEAILACRAEKSKACQPLLPLEEAEAASLDAVYVLRNLAALDETNRALVGELASALLTNSRILAAAGRNAERLVQLRQAEQQLGAGQQDRVDLESDRRVAQVRVEIANALMTLDHDDEAKEMLRRAINTLARLVTVKPENPSFALDTSSAYALQATLLRKAKDESSALTSQSEAARFRSQAEALVKKYLSGAEPVLGNTTTAGDSPEALERTLLGRIERLPTAHQNYDQLRKIYLDLATQHSSGELEAWRAALHSAQLADLLAPPQASEEMKLQLERTLAAAGGFLDGAGKHEDALALREEEVAVATELLDASPQRVDRLGGLAEARFGLALAARDSHRSGWEALLRGAIAAESQVTQRPGANAAAWKRLGQMREVLATASSTRNPAEPNPDCQLALDAFRKAASMDPADEVARASVRQLGRCEGASPARSGLSGTNGDPGN